MSSKVNQNQVENQNTTTQLQTTQIKGMGNMASSGIITGTGNRSNQLQSYDSRRGDLPPKATRPGQQSVVGIRNNREDTQQDMRIDDSRYYNIQGGNNFSRDESPMTKNYRANQQNSIQEESGQLGSQYRRGGGVTSHSILRKSNINEYSVDNNQSMGGAGSRMKHTTAQSGTIIQQNNKNVSRITSQDQTRMNERDRKGFLRVGDIISIQYNEKVYDGDTKSKKKQDGEVQNINLAKITDKPKMIYKGVINTDDYDTLFRIRRQSFSPFQSANYEELKSGENIVIENFFQKYIQIYQDFNDDEMEKFQYKVKSLYHKYSQESTESQIPTVCGFFSKDDVSKMIFEIQEVPKLKAMIAYQAYNFFESFKDFYGFLNYWAVLPCDEDEDAFEKFKYDPQNAVLSEYQLMQNVEDFLTCLLYLDRLLHKAIDENKQSYIQTQNFLSEQGILNFHYLAKISFFYKNGRQ